MGAAGCPRDPSTFVSPVAAVAPFFGSSVNRAEVVIESCSIFEAAGRQRDQDGGGGETAESGDHSTLTSKYRCIYAASCML